MRTITISWRGKSLELQQANFAKTSEYRKLIKTVFDKHLPTIGKALSGLKVGENSAVIPALLADAGAISNLLFDSIDEIAALLPKYDNSLANYAEATDDEIIAAFVEIIKLVFPTQALSKLLGGLTATT